jgi:hypothetical protein
MEMLRPNGTVNLATNPFQSGASCTLNHTDGISSARARSLLDLGPALVQVLRLIPFKDR